MLMERNTLMEWVYPKIKEYCREKHGLEFQVKIVTKYNIFFTYYKSTYIHTTWRVEFADNLLFPTHFLCQVVFLISNSLLHFTLVTSKIICKLTIYCSSNK